MKNKELKNILNPITLWVLDISLYLTFSLYFFACVLFSFCLNTYYF